MGTSTSADSAGGAVRLFLAHNGARNLPRASEYQSRDDVVALHLCFALFQLTMAHGCTPGPPAQRECQEENRAQEIRLDTDVVLGNIGKTSQHL